MKVIGERCRGNLKQLLFQKVAKRKILWKRETLFNSFGQFEKISDPHERKAVYVGESSIMSAGEGLFARRSFDDEQLVSYFGGVKSFRREFWARNRTELLYKLKNVFGQSYTKIQRMSRIHTHRLGLKTNSN